MKLVQSFVEHVKFINSHWYEILVAMGMLFSSAIVACNILISIFLVIPGQQPEKFIYRLRDRLQKAGDFLGRYSRKPASQRSGRK